MRSHRFFRFFAIVAILAAALQIPGVSAETNPQPEGPLDELIERAETEGEVLVIVQVDHSERKEAIDEIAENNDGAEITTEYETFPFVAMSVDADALRKLADQPGVLSIQENSTYAPALADTIPVINGDHVHALGHVGAGQTVAIIDSGIDVDHPFFTGRLVSQACYSNNGQPDSDDRVTLCPDGSNVQETGNAADALTANCFNGMVNICGHGSHVAGIAAGADTTGAPGNGVAPAANIIAIQVFNRVNSATICGDDPAPCLRTNTADMISALERVLDLNATFNNIVAANMSLSGGENATNCDGDEPALKTAIDELLTAGIATVVASGNNGFQNAVGSPGCISTAVTVGRTSNDDSVWPSGNRGPLLDLFAPGTGVLASVPNDTWGTMSGTSMSAPHVAGAFAVLRAASPGATVAQMLTGMQTTGIPITYSIGIPNTTTTPRLNLLAALGEFVVDNTPPTGVSIVINSGATWTNNPNVSLALLANDNFGISRYRLAESQLGLASAVDVNVNPAEPVFSRPSVAFTLTGGQAAIKPVWLRVYDAAGNFTDASNTIGLDTEPPVVTAPPDMQVTAPSADPIVVTYPNATATDNLSAVADGYPQCVPPSGSLFPVGENIVTCSAFDNANNLGSDTFIINVVRDSIQACLYAGSLSQVSPLPYGTAPTAVCGRGMLIIFYQGLDYFGCNYAGSLTQIGTTSPANCGRGSELSIADGVDYWACLFAGSLSQVGTSQPNCSRGVLIGLEQTT